MAFLVTVVLRDSWLVGGPVERYEAGMHREFPGKIRAARIMLALALSTTVACKKTVVAPPSGPLPVQVAAVMQKEIVEWDEFTGRTEAVESVEIRPRVSGFITEVAFKAGAEVKKGDLLFVIDPRPYQADLDRANADLERAQAQSKVSEIDFKRAQELRAKSISSAEEFDQKAAGFQQASASTRMATAAKTSAELNLEFTRIISPIDGRVSDARVTLGNLVQAGAGADNVLTTVVSIDPIHVYVDADENSILKYMKLNAEGKRKTARNETLSAFIQLGNETDFPHEGTIDFVDNRVDATTGTMRARAVFKTWDRLLTPGFFVRMRIAAGPPFQATLVDDKVIGSEQGLKYVFVVKPDKTVERRTVKIGPMVDGLRVVREGLKAGEQVVATRLQMLQPGMPVQAVAP